MIIEDDTFKNFIHRLHNTEASLDDMPLIPRPDRREEKLLKKSTKMYASSYAEFSCEDSKAVYISGPAQLLSDQNHSVPHKVLDWNHLRVFYYVAQFGISYPLSSESMMIINLYIKELKIIWNLCVPVKFPWLD